MQPQYFNGYANVYDAEFTNSPIGKLQRNRVWSFLNRFLTEQKQILEINCGTGEDAVMLASQGHIVTATDISEEMINTAQRKATNNNQQINCQALSFSDLYNAFTEEKFDIILSDFGGLNCVSYSELLKLSDDFSKLLNKQGKLFFVIMGRKCKWEQLYFILKMDFRKAFRRKQTDGIDANINGAIIKTYYYSPDEIVKIFSGKFSLEMVKPVGLFVPPSYLNQAFNNKNQILNLLNSVDNFFCRFSFLSNHADHFAIVLSKT